MAYEARAGLAGGLANTAGALGNVLMSIYGNRQAAAAADQERKDTLDYRTSMLDIQRRQEERLREQQRIDREETLRQTNDRFREFMAGREERGYGYREAPLPATGLAVPKAVPNVGSFILERASAPVPVRGGALSERTISLGYDPTRDRDRINTVFEQGMIADRQADTDARRHANAMALVRARSAEGRATEGTDEPPMIEGTGGRLFPDNEQGRRDYVAWERYHTFLKNDPMAGFVDDPAALEREALGVRAPTRRTMPVNSSGLLNGILPGTERGPMQARPAASAGAAQPAGEAITPEEYEGLIELGYTEEEIRSMFTVGG